VRDGALLKMEVALVVKMAVEKRTILGYARIKTEGLLNSWETILMRDFVYGKLFQSI
jgi:hypothetical protein